MTEKRNPAKPTPGGARTPLKQALPLSTPYLIQIFPAYACNLRCGYCLHALDRRQHGYISDCTLMDMALYRKAVDSIKRFPQKLKMLRFAAIGEPLLHPQIAEMVAYAKKADVAESIDIVTNGTLLTRELSDALIRAGLGRLRISIEGLSAAAYRNNAATEIDFEAFQENLRYFYQASRGKTEVYIKIIDYMVKTQEEEALFYAMFEPVCDFIAIEHLTPTIEGIDYKALAAGGKADKPQNGEKLLKAEICPQPFYMMQINADGKVVPCCSMRYPAILGDVRELDVTEIWNGGAFESFRSNMKKARRKASAVCAACKLYLYDLHPEDILD